MENKDIKILIVPDVHGRDFWAGPVMDNLDKDIVFLGDYLDPYPCEGITPQRAIEVFGEILEIAKGHKNVNLLIGNHDAGYCLSTGICECRHDWLFHADISKMFSNNFDLFFIAKEKVVNKRHFFFSHAGVHPDWLRDNGHLFGTGFKPTAKRFNDLLRGEKCHSFICALSDVSSYRGGWGGCGSMLWADVREFCGIKIPSKKIQVVGHTMLRQPVVLNDGKFYCLDDTKDVFYIDSEGIIRYYNTDKEVL